MDDASVKDLLHRLETGMLAGQAAIGAKLDTANAQFNQHLIDDATKQTELRLTMAALEARFKESELRKREESERRLKQMEAKEARESGARWAKWGVYGAIAAAVITVILTSVLSYGEHHGNRALLEQIKAEQKVGK